MMVVTLSPELRGRLAAFPVVGTGGYQTLMSALKDRLKGDQLDVSPDLYERLQHYAYDFGKGGWQLFLRELLSAIDGPSKHP